MQAPVELPKPLQDPMNSHKNLTKPREGPNNSIRACNLKMASSSDQYMDPTGRMRIDTC